MIETRETHVPRALEAVIRAGGLLGDEKEQGLTRLAAYGIAGPDYRQLKDTIEIHNLA